MLTILIFFYNFDNFWQLTTILTIQAIAFAILTIEKTILKTCDIWDTDYNSDNWEPEFMTIFVTWPLIVTLDSIRNSCDVSPIALCVALYFVVVVTTGCGIYVWKCRYLSIHHISQSHFSRAVHMYCSLVGFGKTSNQVLISCQTSH